MLVELENVTRIDLFVIKLSALRIERAKNTELSRAHVSAK